MESTKEELEEMKREFFNELNQYFEKNTANSIRKPWYKERVKETVNKIVSMRATTEKKTSCYYHLVKKFDIMEVDEEMVLIQKRNTLADPIVRIVPVEDFFEILHQIHKNTGHGGRDRMMERIKLNYYIPRSAVETFIKLCSVCCLKKQKKQQ